MYSTLLSVHSVFRWLVLISLLIAIYRSSIGWYNGKKFSSIDNTIRHSTATIIHLQLTIGIWLYCISPLISYFFHNFEEAITLRESRFFGMEHSVMMLLAAIIISIGSAKAKRKLTDREKYKTMTIWFVVGLLIILINIPWPFSPMSARPLMRPF